MHCRSSRNVQDAQTPQEALGRPDPVGREAVDDGVQKGEDDVGAQFRALRHGPGNDSCRCCGERQLEDEARKDVAHVLLTSIHEEGTYASEGVLLLLPPGGVVESGAEAKHPEGQSAKDDVNGVLHHDVDFVLAATSSRLQQSEP